MTSFSDHVSSYPCLPQNSVRHVKVHSGHWSLLGTMPDFNVSNPLFLDYIIEKITRVKFLSIWSCRSQYTEFLIHRKSVLAKGNKND